MKITVKTTTIEASADDLRQSNTLAESMCGMLRRAFNGTDDEEAEEEND